MYVIKGKYNEAKIYAKTLDETSYSQILNTCNDMYLKDTSIAIMPDAHAGKDCVIGTTMTIKNYVAPAMVGVDIGCGVIVVKLKEKEIDFQKIQDTIENFIPSGFNVRNEIHPFASKFEKKFFELYSLNAINKNRAMLSLGSLGGGNHYIAIEKNENNGDLFLIIHSGSRSFGADIAKYYINKTKQTDKTKLLELKKDIIKQYKIEGKEKLLTNVLSKITVENDNSSYLKGEMKNQYINDMEIAKAYASLNRKIMIDEIINRTKLTPLETFETIHNYIDAEDGILRKGAVKSLKNNKFIIPINMKDGSLICEGKSNPDWNYSAPHGAGRLMSRSQAKLTLNLENFSKEMSSIWTKSVALSTLDEAPGAYKPIEEIINAIEPTAKILYKIKTVYNYKSK